MQDFNQEPTQEPTSSQGTNVGLQQGTQELRNSQGTNAELQKGSNKKSTPKEVLNKTI